MTALHVHHITGFASIQDHGRHGYAHLAVPPSGAFDRPSHDFANRVVGNADDAATIELARGSMQCSFDQDTMFTVTGAPVSIVIDGRQRESQRAIHVTAGTPVLIASQNLGMRSYLAVRGGIEAERVMGSASYDELSKIGPAPLKSGDSLQIGTSAASTPAVARQVTSGVNVASSATLRLHKGPRWGFCENTQLLLESEYTVTAKLNRIGVRLAGPAITWNTEERLASEGVLTGAVQIAADGQPILFGPDHPTTGGYPVVAIVDERDLAVIAQLAPGTAVRFIQALR